MGDKAVQTGRSRRTVLDMTQGTPWRLILKFTLPLLVGNILQQLYNIVDSMVVGNLIGIDALAAVGTTFPIIFLINSLFMGIGMGASIIISQYFGAGDAHSVKKSVDTIYVSMFIAALPVTLLGLLISRPLLVLINTPADILQLSTTYMQIIFIGTLASFGYNINSGILQGLGDSRSPVTYLAIATVTNILLDLLFVGVFSWGVAGVAWATVISQVIAFAFGLYHINRHQSMFRLSWHGLIYDRAILFDSIRLGLPAGIQNMMFSLGTMVMQSLINSYQAVFMAGFNGANKIDSFAFLPMLTFSTAITTYVGQNIGAGRIDRVKHGLRSAMWMSLIVCVLICGLILVLAGPLMRMFTQDQAVVAAGEQYLYRVVPFYFLLAALFLLNGTLRGAGESVIPLLASMASLWLARVPLAYWLAAAFGRDNMFFSFPLGWLLGLLIVIPYYIKGRWKNKSMVRTDPARMP